MDFGGQFRAADGNLTVGSVRGEGFFHDAGIREGDRIVSIDGQNVTSEADFTRFAQAAQGRVPLVVMRDGSRQEIMANFDQFHRAARSGSSGNGSGGNGRAALGIWFIGSSRGAYVLHVLPGSPAERAGLRPGDWITSINGAPASSWQTVAEALDQSPPESNLEIQVARSPLGNRRMQARVGSYDEVFAAGEDSSPVSNRPSAGRPDGGASNNTRSGRR